MSVEYKTLQEYTNDGDSPIVFLPEDMRRCELLGYRVTDQYDGSKLKLILHGEAAEATLLPRGNFVLACVADVAPNTSLLFLLRSRLYQARFTWEIGEHIALVKEDDTEEPKTLRSISDHLSSQD